MLFSSTLPVHTCTYLNITFTLHDHFCLSVDSCLYRHACIHTAQLNLGLRSGKQVKPASSQKGKKESQEKRFGSSAEQNTQQLHQILILKIASSTPPYQMISWEFFTTELPCSERLAIILDREKTTLRCDKKQLPQRLSFSPLVLNRSIVMGREGNTPGPGSSDSGDNTYVQD